jgi:hypothetical protein
MSNTFKQFKIKLFLFKGLYWFYALLADLSKGNHFFTRKKINMGCIIITASMVACSPRISKNQDNTGTNGIHPTHLRPMCYEVAVVKSKSVDTTKHAVKDTTTVAPMCYSAPENIDCYISIDQDSLKPADNPKK